MTDLRVIHSDPAAENKAKEETIEKLKDIVDHAVRDSSDFAVIVFNGDPPSIATNLPLPEVHWEFIKLCNSIMLTEQTTEHSKE